MDLPRLRSGDLFTGTGSGIVVDDQDLVDEAGRFEVLDATPDRIPLVVGRQDQRNNLSLPDG
jgi:hypothetical protein